MTAAALTWFQIAILTTYSVAMSLGQVLFKLAALRYTSGNSIKEQLLALAFNWYFLAALLLYCGLAVLWVWISVLRRSPVPIHLSQLPSSSPRCWAV